MRDLVFLGYLALLFGMGLKRPFLLVLIYAYMEIGRAQV